MNIWGVLILKIICYASAVQIWLGILYFYLLNLVTLPGGPSPSGRSLLTSALVQPAGCSCEHGLGRALQKKKCPLQMTFISDLHSVDYVLSRQSRDGRLRLLLHSFLWFIL